MNRAIAFIKQWANIKRACLFQSLSEIKLHPGYKMSSKTF